MKRLLLVAILALLSSNIASAHTISHKVLHHAENVSVFMTANVETDRVDQSGQVDRKFQTNAAICGGFVLFSKGTEEVIVTARHCVTDEIGTDTAILITPVSVHFFNGDVARIESIYPSLDYDVAIMLTHSTRRHSERAHLATHVHRADPLFLLGMPNGYLWTYTEGYSMNGDLPVGATTDQQIPTPYHDMMQFSCDSCYFGNSGGGIFNTRGEVVGVMSSTSDFPNTYLLTPSREIQDTLNGLTQ